MKEVSSVLFKPGTREELLPDYTEDFPHIHTCYRLQENSGAPWHWHKAAELFYMESGYLEYSTPSGRHLFSTGCGGFVNTNVLHMTRGQQVRSADLQQLHLFDPVLISGSPGSRMDTRYVLPLSTASQVEILALHPDEPSHREALELLRRSFLLSPDEPGYELRIRSILSEIWVHLLQIAQPALEHTAYNARISQQLKQMILYIETHYSEKISIAALAESACISERSCYHLFRKHLQMTPVEYINRYRLRIACQMLTQTQTPITLISTACGLGSSSYFASLFHRMTGCTPLEYRNRYTLSHPQRKKEFS